MSMLNFYTPTILDEAFIFTMGASVKKNASPIGFFGTGLKYAIAITLRLKGNITIYTPDVRYQFVVQSRELRGESIEMIECLRTNKDGTVNKINCPMTTGYGKQWEAWMALRELYSNTIDEKGECYEDVPIFPKSGDWTIITVDCAEIYDAWLQRDRYFINTKRTPIYETESFVVYLGRCDGAYYRGIRILKDPVNCGMTYNIKSLAGYTLTEDRTLTEHALRSCLRLAFLQSPKNAFTEAFINQLMEPKSFEATCDASFYGPHSFIHLETLDSLCDAYRLYPERLPDTWQQVVMDHFAKTDIENLYPQVNLVPTCEARFAECIDFLKSKGLKFDRFTLHFTDRMPQHHHASSMMHQNRIIMNVNNTLLHDNWHEETCKTLIEEYIHLTHRVYDESRAMQDVYNEYIYRLLRNNKIP